MNVAMSIAISTTKITNNKRKRSIITVKMNRYKVY